MATLRAFIAIALSEAVRGRIAEAQRLLRRETSLDVRWVDSQSAHLTLKFLGAVNDSKVAAIGEAMAQVARQAMPFDLSTGEIGAFPSLRRPRVLWLGLDGNLEPLLALQRSLGALVAPLGFPTEARAFSPHLTLGRVREGLAPYVPAPPASLTLESVTQRVESIVLMQSILRPDGAQYRRLLHLRFGDTWHPSQR